MLYTYKSEVSGKLFAKDPAVIEIGGKILLYHSIMNDTLGIGIAESDDGKDFIFNQELPITQECEKNGIGAPAAIKIDGIVHLFYQTYGNGKLDAICHAVSKDGYNFIKDETNPVFAPRRPWAEMPEWSCGRAIDADVCVFGDKLLLYFATRDKDMKDQLLGVASAPLSSDFSSGSWELYPDIVLKPELDWEKRCIEAPAALVKDGFVYLFYAGAYNCEPQQIGCAVSEDGFTFRRLFIKEPLMKNGPPGSWNQCESGHPYIYETEKGDIWLYYQGSADMGKSWYLSRQRIAFKDDKPILI